MRSKDRAPSRWLEKWQAAGSTGQMPGAGALRRSATAAIAAASAQPIAPKLMNRCGGDARAEPVSDERPARFCDDVRPAPFFDPRRVATIAQHYTAFSVMLMQLFLPRAIDLKKRTAWIDAKDNRLVMRYTARKPAILQARVFFGKDNPC